MKNQIKENSKMKINSNSNSRVQVYYNINLCIMFTVYHMVIILDS